jgi:hypothetical protein
VLLVSQGRLTHEVIAITGFSPKETGQLVRSGNAHGTDALDNGRRYNRGASLG